MKVISGKERELIQSFQSWEKERKPRVPGVMASLVLQSDRSNGEFIGVAVFKDKASYTANAKDPEQDKWYTQMRSYLQSDPEWNDGEYVFGKIG